jgi:oligosaccharide repeat unit polymerase
MRLDQPLVYWLAAATLAILVVEAAMKLARPWAIPSLVAYATVGAWYLLEPINFPEFFLQFGEAFDSASIQVIIFLLMFRIAVPPLTDVMSPPGIWRESVAHIPAETVLVYASLLWVFLFVVGTVRLEGDFITALFPLESRWAGGNMWSRAAAGDAGSSGFFVSTAGYLYSLVVAAFGMLLPFLTRWQGRVFAILLIILSWPYFLLSGSRNIFLVVLIPSFASFALFSPRPTLVKLVAGAAIFAAVDFWFRVVIAYRDVGFAKVFDEGLNSSIYQGQHVGLNMMSELCYMNMFYNNGLLTPSLGLDYLIELANIIPRAIWPDKPLIGIDYAQLRGFGGSTSDTGVVATISHGIIGQGYKNFGPIIGPIVSALLFATWIALLARFRRQENSVLRLGLFLLGLALTFNMGRDISLLVLWPMVFGYIIVRLWERFQNSAGSPLRGEA